MERTRNSNRNYGAIKIKKYCIIIALFMIGGCQSVQTEDGRTEYQLNPAITGTAHAVIDALDTVARPVCDITGAACDHVIGVGEAVVGVESTDEPVVDKPEGEFDALFRVVGLVATLLLAV